MKQPKYLRVSRKLWRAIKLADEPAYKIAWRADVHPNTLSKLLHGAERVRPSDPRILRVAKIVGIPANAAFEWAKRG